MNKTLIQLLLCIWFGIAIEASAQITNLLLQDVSSREVGISVGSVSFPPYQDLASRETTFFVGTEPEAPYQEVLSRELTFVVTTPAAPARVSQLEVAVTPLGDRATLSWAGYNQWAEADVVGYAIYLADHPFSSIAGLIAYTNVPGETFALTLAGLATYRDRFFAIVPMDANGNSEPIVNYASFYSIAREVVSREAAIFVGTEPESPFKDLNSRELTIVVSTPAAPAPVTQLSVVASPLGDRAMLSWAGYNQWAEADVTSYAVYLANKHFTTVAGMTAYTNVPGETFALMLDGLGAYQDHFFAIVPVDATGRIDFNVHSSAAYSLAGEVVSRETTIFTGGESEPPAPQLVSREWSVVVSTADVPAPVTALNSGFAASMSRRALSAIDLEWSAYNAWGQNDIVGYRLYQKPAPDEFLDVTGLDPVAFLPGETTHWTLSGLQPLNVYYLAVVAEDALGQINPVVRSVSAQASIGKLGEVQQLQVACGSNSLHFTWEPPDYWTNFLASYRIYVGATQLPVVLDRNATDYTANNLLPAHGYPVRITTVDNTARETESDGTSLLAATLLAPPARVLAQGLDTRVRVSWDHIQPFDLLRKYAVYYAETNFSTTQGLVPQVTRDNRLDITGLINGKAYYFAVASINVAGGVSGICPVVTATPNMVTGDFADLMIFNIAAPQTVYPGQLASFAWAVTNIGPGATSLLDGTPVNGWTDRIVLSSDDVLGNSDDIPIAVLRHSSALGFGAAYATNATVRIPKLAPGDYHIFVNADALDEVYEYLDAGANAARAPQTLQVELAARPDLSIAMSQLGQPTLTINGSTGPDYILQVSTNLVRWDDAVTNVSPATLPFQWTDTNTIPQTQRFYRVRLEP